MPFWRPIYRLGSPNSSTPKTLFKFFFSCTLTRICPITIKYFTMHLIISKLIRRQKCRQKRKTIRQKDVKRKEEILYESVFINLNT